jgi:hypothetical protein
MLKSFMTLGPGKIVLQDGKVVLYAMVEFLSECRPKNYKNIQKTVHKQE